MHVHSFVLQSQPKLYPLTANDIRDGDKFSSQVILTAMLMNLSSSRASADARAHSFPRWLCRTNCHSATMLPYVLCLITSGHAWWANASPPVSSIAKPHEQNWYTKCCRAGQRLQIRLHHSNLARDQTTSYDAKTSQ